MTEPNRTRFVQTRLQWRAECELLEDGVLYECSSLLSRSATRVPFESMPDDPVREARISRFWAVAVSLSFVALLFSVRPLIETGAPLPVLAIVVSLLALVVSALGLRAESGRFVVFPSEGKRVEFRDDGGEPSLPEFLEQLQVEKSTYLSATYGPRPSEPEGSSVEFTPFDEPEDDPGPYRH